MTPRILSIFVCALLLGVGTAQSRPRLGVRLTLGVPVEAVENGSPSDRAGLKAGDFIVSCDDEVIQNMQALVDWADRLGAGSKARMTVIRGGERKALEISLPDPLPEGQKLGMTVGTGFLVTRVSQGMPAAKAGVLEGDVLVAFGGRAVESFDGLRAEIAKVKPGATKTVRVVRSGKELVLDVPFSGPDSQPRLLLPPSDAKESPKEDVEQEETPEEILEEPILPDEEMKQWFHGFSPTQGSESPRLTELAKELGDAIEELKAVANKGDAVASALVKMQRVKKGLEAHIRRRRGMDRFFQRGLEGLRGFPVLPTDLEGGFGGFSFDSMMEDLQQRVQELVEQGLGSQDINGILEKEFPGVKIRVHSDSAPTEKKTPEKKTPSKGDGGERGSGH